MTEQGVVETRGFVEILVEVGAGELTSESFWRLSQAAYETQGRIDQFRDVVKNWSEESQNVSSVNRTVLHGYCCFLARDLKRAEEILAVEKTTPWAPYFLARVKLALNRHEDALSIVEAASKRFPDCGALTLLAVEVYCRNGWEDQVPALLEALKGTLPGTSAVPYATGLYLERLGQYAEAVESYREAVGVDPDNGDAWFRLGFCLDLRGRGDEESLDEAIYAYEQCLKVVPPRTNAIINLGVLYEDRERYHDAIKCYETVLRFNPLHERARLFLDDARASTRMFYDRDEEKKADRQSQVLKIPVTDFELSVRSRNCLQKMNITTLGDLIMKTEQELLSYKNFGETSLKEIKDMLGSKVLRLGQGLEQKGADMSAPRNPLEATADPGVLDRPIDDLSFSVRSRRCMERLGVKSVRDLINMTEVQLMSAKNFGMTSLNEIKRKLAELGMQLRG